MFLSREIDIKLYQNVSCKILYKLRSTKQIIFIKYGTNLKTTIYQRSLRISWLLPLFFEFNKVSFSIDIIDIIIYASVTFHQNLNQWQCSIIVKCLCLYHVTSILDSHWRDFWSCDAVSCWHSFMPISFDRNIRLMSYRYRSTPEILRFQPIPPFIFP